MPKTVLRVFYILPWLAAVFAVLWIVIQRFPPSGTVTFDVPFDGSSAWMDPFLPAERTTGPGAQEGGWRGQRILQDPVYSAARVPGVYESVDVEIEFRPVRQTLIEFGILRDEASLSFDFQPLWYEPLQSDGWKEAESSGRHGYVRTAESGNLPSSSNYQKLALWHASATPLMMRDEPGEIFETAISLRGSHDIWALPAGDRLAFTFAFQDSNRRAGNDAVVIRIMDGDRIIRTEAFGIGGSRDTKMGEMVEKSIAANGLAPGAYRIQIIAEDDVFIRSIRTHTKRWVVGPRLSFGDTVGYATSVRSGIAWSDSRHLVLETFHDEGLQTVTFGNDSVRVTRTHDSFQLNRTDADTLPKKLIAPLGDIRVIGDGYFAFAPESFFVPQPRRVTSFTDPDAEGIDAILTPYERPEDLGDGWYRGTASFSVDPARDHLRFALSAPALLTRAGAVDIRRVTLTYRRPPLSFSEWLRVVRQELANAWRRVRG
jgi:hypothetical protein